MQIVNPELTVYVQLIIGEILFLFKAPRRERFALRFLLSALGCAALVFVTGHLLGTELQAIQPLRYFASWMGAGLCAMLCWKTTLLGAVFVSTGSYAIQHMGFSLSFFLNHSLEPFFDINAFSLVTALATYAVVAGILYAVLIRRNSRFYASADARQVVISCLLLVLCIVLSSLRSICEADLPYIHIYDFLTCLCCLLIQFSISNSERMNEEKKTLELIIRQQHEQHELSSQAVEMMGIKLHDIRSQIRQLQAGMNAEESQKLDGLRRTVQIYSSMANTGNATVDAILMEKGLMCEINHIRFSYIVDGGKLDFMEAVDIFTLLNNILDNAIESELKEAHADKRIISLRVVREGETILIDAENYCNYPVDLGQDMPSTTKEDKANHGIGMKGIRYVVEKYGGQMRFAQQDAMFHIGIIFPAK